MTQGLQFSLLFSGLDALTTGDTAVLKSDMADSAYAEQAAAFRQILQDEQYSTAVKQGQTLAAVTAQQQAHSQSVGATEHKILRGNAIPDVTANVAQESDPIVAEDSDLANSALEDSDLAGQWLGLIRQSSDASAQLKQKAEIASLFFKVQPGAADERIGPVPDEEAELFFDSLNPDLKNAQRGDTGQQKIAPVNDEPALSHKNAMMQGSLPNSVQGKVSTDNLAAKPERAIAEPGSDAGGEPAPRANNSAAADTDELAPKQNATQNPGFASALPQHLPLAGTAVSDTDTKQPEASLPENTMPDIKPLSHGTATNASTLQADPSVAYQSKEQQNETKLQEMPTLSANQTKLAQHEPVKAGRETDNTLQDNLSEVNDDAELLNQTELFKQVKTTAEQQLPAQAMAETATTAVKLNISTDTDTDNPPAVKAETTAQVTATITQPAAQATRPATVANDAALEVKVVTGATAEVSAPLSPILPTQVLAELDKANAVTTDNTLSSAVVAEVTPEDNATKEQHESMSFNRQAGQVSRAGSDIAVTSNPAEINVNLSAKISGKDKSSADQAETVTVNTNKISASKADKGVDTGSSQSEQQGQSRQDSRQYTFNRLEVTLAQNNAQSATTLTANASTQMADPAGAIARAESFATVLEQQNRPQSAVATPSLAAQLKQLNLQQQDAAGQLRERVQLMVRQNVQVAEIRLDPAELGQMQIRVNLQQEQASVQFIVQQQHAKELLEQQMPRLRELLQQQGIQLGEGQVQQQTREDRQQAEQRAAGGPQHNDDKQAGTDNANQATTVELSHSERLVDYYA